MCPAPALCTLFRVAGISWVDYTYIRMREVVGPSSLSCAGGHRQRETLPRVLGRVAIDMGDVVVPARWVSPPYADGACQYHGSDADTGIEGRGRVFWEGRAAVEVPRAHLDGWMCCCGLARAHAHGSALS